MAWITSYPKSTPLPMCYRAEFGRSALKGAGIITGKPPNWGALELCGAGIRCVADPKNTCLSPTCYHAKIDSSAVKGVRINRREPPKLRSAGAPPLRYYRGVDDPKHATPHLYVLSCQIWSYELKRYERY